MCKIQAEEFSLTARTLSKSKIVDTVIELIRQQKPTTFSQISKQLGTRSQSIYNYFSDGNELKAAVTVRFYAKMTQELQNKIFGLSGKKAVLKFCQVSADYAIDDFLVLQYVISLPKEMFHGDKEVESTLDNLYQLLCQLLDPLISDKKQKLVYARLIRSLIAGEVIHIGTGRFDNDLVPADDSFLQMLEIALTDISD